MNHSNIDIVLTGELLGHASLEDACSHLATLFKVSTERAEQIVKNAPVVVKSGLDLDTAKKYQMALAKAGFKTDLRPVTRSDVDMAASTTVEPIANVVADQDAVTPPPSMPPKIRSATPETFKGFTYRIDGQPDFSFLTVQIPANKMLKVEASSMATMDTNLVMKTKMKGGFSRLLSSESIFINEFTAEGGAGEIGIAPATPGDLVHRYLEGETLYLQGSAFVASVPEVVIETKWQGFTKGFFSGENLFLIRASGRGDLWFNSYGAIIEIDVTEGYVVDTGNIVAFTEGLEYKVSKVGGYKSLFFSGEGFVCRFTGKGKIWIQTRSVGAFTGWAQAFRPAKG